MSKKKTLKSIQQGMAASSNDSAGSKTGYNNTGNAGRIGNRKED